MSTDFFRFLGILAVALCAAALAYSLVAPRDPAAAVGVGCAVSIAVIALGAWGLGWLSAAGEPPAALRGVDAVARRRSARLTCPQCAAEFPASEAGWGHAGSMHEYCDTCPRCHHWVRDR